MSILIRIVKQTIHLKPNMKHLLGKLLWEVRKWFNVNAGDEAGITALMDACANGQLLEVERLLARGADAEKQDSQGRTAISYAIDAERPDIVDALANSIPRMRAAFAAAAERMREAEVYRSAVDDYTTVNKLIWRPGYTDEVEQLHEIGLPEIAVVFYRHFEPWQWNWELRFHGSCEIVYHNDREISPNPILQRLGFIEFAATSSGDTLHYNVTEVSERGMPRIYLFPHELIGTMNENELRHSAKNVAADLVDFLQKATRGDLDTIPKVWTDGDPED